MGSTWKRIIVALCSVSLVLAVAGGCDTVRDKAKQGGDAGGSTGYP
jgi:hypothetical protein